jgi:hypothetical protein
LAVPPALDKAAIVHNLDKVACVDASYEGQKDRASGRLRAAHERFVACSSAACPDAVRQACADWLNEVDRATPTVVLAAEEASRSCDGRPDALRDLVTVDVSLDGRPLVHGLDGRAVEIDPGPHVLRFQAPGREPRDESVVLREGQKSRPITATLAGPPPVCASPERPEAPVRPPPSGGPPAGAIVATAVSAVGFGVMAYFGLSANAYYQDHQGCAPHCGADAKATLERLEDAADVSLAVGVVSAALAAWLWLAPRHPAPVAGIGRVGVLSVSF